MPHKRYRGQRTPNTITREDLAVLPLLKQKLREVPDVDKFLSNDSTDSSSSSSSSSCENECDGALVLANPKPEYAFNGSSDETEHDGALVLSNDPQLEWNYPKPAVVAALERWADELNCDISQFPTALFEPHYPVPKKSALKGLNPLIRTGPSLTVSWNPAVVGMAEEEAQDAQCTMSPRELAIHDQRVLMFDSMYASLYRACHTDGVFIQYIPSGSTAPAPSTDLGVVANMLSDCWRKMEHDPLVPHCPTEGAIKMRGRLAMNIMALMWKVIYDRIFEGLKDERTIISKKRQKNMEHGDDKKRRMIESHPDKDDWEQLYDILVGFVSVFEKPQTDSPQRRAYFNELRHLAKYACELRSLMRADKESARYFIHYPLHKTSQDTRYGLLKNRVRVVGTIGFTQSRDGRNDHVQYVLCGALIRSPWLKELHGPDLANRQYSVPSSFVSTCERKAAVITFRPGPRSSYHQARSKVASRQPLNINLADTNILAAAQKRALKLEYEVISNTLDSSDEF